MAGVAHSNKISQNLEELNMALYWYGGCIHLTLIDLFEGDIARRGCINVVACAVAGAVTELREGPPQQPKHYLNDGLLRVVKPLIRKLFR